MVQKASREGLIEIAAHEGIVLCPYRDSKGVWTFGIGHTAAAGAPDPSEMPKAEERPVAEVMALFARDIARYEADVRRAFSRELSQAQFDAALSFHFNTGAIGRATWVKDFNAGNVDAARVNFMNWRKPPEIVPRRQKECDLFFDGRYAAGGYATIYSADASGAVQWAKGRKADVGALLEQSSGQAPEPPKDSNREPDIVVAEKPVAIPGLDKPLGKSTTFWSAVGGFVTTILAALSEPWVQALLIVVAAGFAVWIIRERRKKALAHRSVMSNARNGDSQ